MHTFAPEPPNLLLQEVLHAHNRIDIGADYRRGWSLSTAWEDRLHDLYPDPSNNHRFSLSLSVGDVWVNPNAEGIRLDHVVTCRLDVEMNLSKIMAITMRADGKDELVRLIFEDGSAVDLRGPRSGMKIIEHTEGSVAVATITFEGFHIIKRTGPPNDGRPAI